MRPWWPPPLLGAAAQDWRQESGRYRPSAQRPPQNICKWCKCSLGVRATGGLPRTFDSAQLSSTVCRIYSAMCTMWHFGWTTSADAFSFFSKMCPHLKKRISVQLVPHLNRVHVHSQFLQAANCGRISHCVVLSCQMVLHSTGWCTPVSVSVACVTQRPKRCRFEWPIAAQCSSQQPTATPWWEQILIELLATNTLSQSSQSQSGMI